MNDNDIKEFMNAFQDFMQHASAEEKKYAHREEAREYTQNFYETKAAELEITVDYYMMEFM